MGIAKESFGTTKDGKEVYAFVLENAIVKASGGVWAQWGRLQ